jgi:hypothetical protein
MTVTNVQINQEAQQFLIKAAALRNVSVEQLASEILSHGIQAELSGMAKPSQADAKLSVNSLADLQPYAFHATPEESIFPYEEWDMEQKED